ncbi:MAG: NAD(P)-dependent alcohol dehydrogenase [Bacteroidia bacterium]
MNNPIQTNQKISSMDTSQMKAVVCTKYGGPEVLQVQEVAKPIPKENEVLVRIHASTVTAADTFMREGTPYVGRLMLGLLKPKNPVTGTGFSGVVEAVGTAVTTFKPGDKVFGESIFGYGTNAEYSCVSEEGVIARLPENVSFEETASICDGPMTSLNLMRNLANIQAGQEVMIIGASGALGTAAVQLAKHFGARVTGVCSGANAALVKSLGADEVIDYRKEDFRENGKSYDIIYDTVGKSSFPKAKRSLKKEGIYLSPVLGLPLLWHLLWTSLFGSKKVKFGATGMKPVPELRVLLQELREMLAAGKLKTVIDRRYKMSEIAEAHRYVDTGHKKGNLVLGFE